MYKNKKFFLVFVLVLFLFFTGYSDNLTKRRLASVRAELRAEPDNYVGNFPVTINFKGKITAMKAGIIKYRFEWKNGSVGITKSVMFASTGIKNVGFSHQFGAPANGWVKLRILSPVNISSNLATYSLRPKLLLAPGDTVKPLKQKLKIKPKVHMQPKFTIKKLANWKKLTKIKMPDLVIQSFKFVGSAGFLGEVSRVETIVANAGNSRSGKCELSITMYVPEDIPRTEENCPGCKFTRNYDIPELEPGTSCTVESSWIFTQGPGLWKFVAKADYVRLKYKGVVAEINEDNNKATTFLVVHY